MFTTQSGNHAEGDVVGGDKITLNVSPGATSAIVNLYARLRSDNQHTYTSKISEKLQHYCNESTDGDIRGLEVKLNAANRTDMLQIAARMKQEAAMLIMRFQTSPIAQDIITLVLCKIWNDFVLQVTPSIEAEAPRNTIDSLINEKVINPAITMLGDNDLMITDTDVLGLLFYLGGNCHIRWDKC